MTTMKIMNKKGDDDSDKDDDEGDGDNENDIMMVTRQL